MKGIEEINTGTRRKVNIHKVAMHQFCPWEPQLFYYLIAHPHKILPLLYAYKATLCIMAACYTKLPHSGAYVYHPRVLIGRQESGSHFYHVKRRPVYFR